MPKHRLLPFTRHFDDADCTDFEPASDPGGTSASGDPRIAWVACRGCGQVQPTYADSGRLASFLVY